MARTMRAERAELPSHALGGRIVTLANPIVKQSLDSPTRHEAVSVGASFLAALWLVPMLACGAIAARDNLTDLCAEVSGVCECSPGGDECSELEVCITSGEDRVCACGPAYKEGPNGCEFNSAPADPGFNDSAVWTAEGSALIEETSGDIDPGEAVFTGFSLCRLDSVSQQFPMPTSEGFQQLVAELNSVMVIPPLEFDRLRVGVQIGGGWNEVPVEQQFVNQSLCLGEAVFGGGATQFRVVPGRASDRCTTSDSSFTQLRVDRLALRPAMEDECPPLGKMNNPDMESDGGWTFATSGFRSATATAGFAEGVGSDDSRAVRMTAVECATTSATARISIPSATTTPNTAIEFFTSGSENTQFTLSLENGRLARSSNRARFDGCVFPTGRKELCRS